MRFVPVAVHAAQDGVGNMLDRHVQIRQNARICTHLLDQFVVDFIRVAIKNPDPRNACFRAQTAQQFRQGGLFIQIDAVARRVFGDQVQFFRPRRFQVPSFFNDAFNRAGTVASANFRNGAIGTAVVAPFGYAQKSGGRIVGQHAFAFDGGFLVVFKDRVFIGF